MICSQNFLSCSTRRSGALPAISAPLIAPIEMPATQSGCRSASASACVDAGLVGAERAAALQQQRDAFERGPRPARGVALRQELRWQQRKAVP